MEKPSDECTSVEWPSGHDVDAMALGIAILNEDELEDLNIRLRGIKQSLNEVVEN